MTPQKRRKSRAVFQKVGKSRALNQKVGKSRKSRARWSAWTLDNIPGGNSPEDASEF